MNAREMIKKAYGNSKNMMTSSVISYGKIGKNMAYELSWGRGIFSPDLYGVTIASVRGGTAKREDGLSTCFNKKKDAMDYIKELKRKYG